MSVNGITSIGSVADSYLSKSPSTISSDSQTSEESVDVGVSYEKSNTTEKSYTKDKDLIARLQADATAQTEKLRSLVEKLMLKQAKTYDNSNGIWRFLASGNFTVNEATKLAAQADIAEDGYWGVESTSDRIVDFAKALAANNPEKAEELKEAFKKGYEKAEATWGGSLPDICRQTYAAVIDKLDTWAADTSTINSFG